MEKHEIQDIVRCGECKFQYINENVIRFCMVWRQPNGFGDEGYCHYGERITNHDV